MVVISIRIGGAENAACFPYARSPNLNAYAERFVRSIKSECLAQIIPLGEQHLRNAMKEYTEHYHLERNHQGLDNQLIEKTKGVVDMNAAVVRHERLGGVLNYYERRAGRVLAQYARARADSIAWQILRNAGSPSTSGRTAQPPRIG